MRRLAPLALALVLAGCSTSGAMRQTHRAFEDAYPEARFERTLALSFGPLTMGFARFLTRLVPDQDARIAADLLRDVRRVRVAIYQTDGVLQRRQPFGLHDLDGWDLAVRVHEDDETVFIYVREDADEVRDLFVAVLADDELVLAEVRGNLERLTARAMREYGPGSE